MAEVNRDSESPTTVEFPLLPMALAGGAAAAMVGWLLVIGLVMIGWFTAMAMPVPRMLGFAGQLWLAGHGAGATIGDITLTLIPLGLSVLFVLLTRTVVGSACVPRRRGAGRLGAVKAWGLATCGYGFVGAVVSLPAGAAPRIGWAVLGGLVVGGLGAGWVPHRGCARLVTVPAWLQGLPRAIAGRAGHAHRRGARPCC